MTEMDFTTREEATGEVCPVCGEKLMERVTVVAGRQFRHRMECSCDKQRRAEEQKREYSEGLRKLRGAARRVSGIPSRYQTGSLSRLGHDLREGQEAAHRALCEFYSEWQNDRHTPGVLLVGATGCGKSTFAAAAANDLIDGYTFSEDDALRCRRCGDPAHPFTPVYYVNVPMLFTELRNAMDEKSSAAEVMRKYSTVPVLILDDLGAEYHSEYSRSVLLQIIDYRWCERLPLIVTANARRLEDLEASTGERGRDRLESICLPVPLSCPSQRRLGGL